MVALKDVSPLQREELLVLGYVQSAAHLQSNVTREWQVACGKDTQFVGGVVPKNKNSGHRMFIIIERGPHVCGPDREICGVARGHQLVTCCYIVVVSAACEVVHVW